MPQRPLPPLEPTAYLRWLWEQADSPKCSRPYTLAEWAAWMDADEATARRSLLGMAAWRRRTIRLRRMRVAKRFEHMGRWRHHHGE